MPPENCRDDKSNGGDEKVYVHHDSLDDYDESPGIETQ